jgi:hypothetical protein
MWISIPIIGKCQLLFMAGLAADGGAAAQFKGSNGAA